MIAWCLTIGVHLAAATNAVDVAEPVEVDVIVTACEEAEIPARQAGSLAELRVCEGSTVDGGEEVGRVEDDEQRAAVRRAEIELAAAALVSESDVPVRSARKALEVAQTELARAETSQEIYSRSVSSSEIDRLRLAVEQAQLELEEAQRAQRGAKLTTELKENELASARLALDRRRIVAPFSGTVVQILAQRGEWVQPGDSVLRIVRLDRLRAEGFLPARLAPFVPSGRAVRLVVAADDGQTQAFDGEIGFASPEIDPVDGQFRFWAEFDNLQGSLRPGQHGRLSIPVTP